MEGSFNFANFNAKAQPTRCYVGVTVSLDAEVSGRTWVVGTEDKAGEKK